MRKVWLLLVIALTSPAYAEETCLRLKAFSNLGVPVHPESGNPGVVDRLADGTIAQQLETDEGNGWIRIRANAVEGWIIRKYVDMDVPCPSVSPAPEPEAAELAYVVGCWNLEHFHDGATRGFPEYTFGGPTYPARTQQEYETIAAVIEQLDLKIVALSEIFAREVEILDENEQFTDVRSSELERLIEILGTDNYDYIVGASGERQHLAILYDKRFVDLNASWEMELPRIKIEGKYIADRQPLVAHFTFKDGDDQKNDLGVVAVHLASGQQNDRNHDEAIRLIRQELAKAQQEGWCLPIGENDILVMGDLNANRFDNHEEEFWDSMESGGWDVLADDISSYSPTRLSDHPLGLNNSRIDYIIATQDDQGLRGEEISQAMATVHKELLQAGAEEFRRRCSDHLPVTVKVKVTADTDEEEVVFSDRLRRYYVTSEN